ELHAAHAELVDELGRHLDERAAAGEASGLAARRLALAAVVARAELARAEAGLARARAAALAWRPDLDRELRPELPELPAPPDQPDLSGRRDLAARRAELEQARIEARLAGRLITAPELRLGWKELRDASTVVDGPVLGLAWRLPIAGRRRAARLSSSAQLTTAEAELALGEATAQAELQGSRDAYAGLRRAALATAGTDVALIVRAARSAYRLGESDTTDLLDTLRSVLAAELARLDLHAAALGARRDLEAALGRPLVRWTEFGQRPKSRSESAFASNCGQ
ncbi:MAG: TolC family protein, partial [FCB group bacterium]|nr:TolC family protein [FCB group bacterium]